MTGLLAILLIGLWALLMVLPVLATRRASRAARQVEALRAQLARLAEDVAALREHVAATDPVRRATVAPDAAGAAASATEPAIRQGQAVPEGEPPGVRPAPTVGDISAGPGGTFEGERFAAGTASEPAPPSASAPPAGEPQGPVPPGAPARPISLEDRIGSRWLLYLGIATLVLGASYFIKYAFENNWVTPLMRVATGAGGGLALVEAGRRFSRRDLAFYGQMLTAGGLVLLYLAVYAALDFYALLAPPAAFFAMVLVTALATFRADRETSQGLALLAVAGGFVTPFLVSSSLAGQHVLFAYDALLVAGTVWLARRHEWPALHLVSFVAAGLTLATWFDRYYVPARWLPTQLWFTLFALLFLLIWQTLPALATGLGRLVRLALGTTPLLYHAVSLQILWRRPAGLAVYLIAVSVAGLIAAGHRGRVWLRAATWVLVALPALGWLAARPARWDVAPFVTLVSIYALHLVTELRETAGRATPPLPLEIALLHGNGLWLWGGLALLLEKLALSRMSAMTFALAAWYGALAAGVTRRQRELTLHLLALGAAFLAAGLAIEFDGAAVTVAWATEGAALVAIGLAVGRPWLQGGGGALLAVAVARLARDLLSPLPVTATLFLNVRSLSTLFVIALLALLARRIARHRVASRGRAFDALVVTASVLLLLWTTSEVNAWFAQRAWVAAQATGVGAVTSAELGRQVTLSLVWAGYALVLVAVGIRRQYRPVRLLGIAFFGLTLGKVFLVDLARLDRFYRILSTVGLGLLLLGASYLYQRFTREHARMGAHDGPRDPRPDPDRR